jgi:hypothetical protein
MLMLNVPIWEPVIGKQGNVHVLMVSQEMLVKEAHVQKIAVVMVNV